MDVKCTVLVLSLMLVLAACTNAPDLSKVEAQAPSAVPSGREKSDEPMKPHEKAESAAPGGVAKNDEAWREALTPEQFQIARKKGTECAFTGEYWDTKTPGVYRCVCCGEALFDSEHKYASGTGWPSFYQPVDSTHVRTEKDTTLAMVRSEVLCSRCGAHLGHVFEDGPKPTGLRYCINSASLTLEERKGE